MTSSAESRWATDLAAFRGGLDLPAGGPLGEQFARLTRNLLDATSIGGVLEQVVRAAHRVIPGADLVSITLRAADGTFHTPTETDSLATELDLLQYETGEGPCLTAAEPSGPAEVRSDDLAAERAWPRFGPAAAAHGVRAMLAVALLPDASPPRYSGALNIYCLESGALGTDAHLPALLLATHASLALAGTTAVTRAELTAAQLAKAIDSRDVIGQAKGILMARRGISADEAFDHLRRVSQQLNIKIADIARIVATRHDELDLTTTHAPPGAD